MGFNPGQAKDELNDFKTKINLSQYAASRGYQKVARKSCKNSLTMQHPNGHKIIVSRGHDRHWTYFNVHQPADKGSIIDFIQQRTPMGLGQLRQSLRVWLGKPIAPTSELTLSASPKVQSRQRVNAAFASTHVVNSSSYLASRGLNVATLNDPRFQGKIRQDSRSNSVFPHYDPQGLCGFELKNYRFTGFASGGVKGIWYSRKRLSDQFLVITESAIDALSYHQLHQNFHTRYFSTAGTLSESQWRLIKSVVAKMPEDCIVVIAFDNDESGNLYADALSRRLPLVRIKRAVPKLGKDWNEQLTRST